MRKNLFGDQFLLPTLLQLIPQKLVVADLGCGTGESVVALAPVTQKVIGVDQSHEMLSICQRRTSHLPNIDLRQGSLEKLPIENDEVDAVFCMLVLHHVKKIRTAFHEMSRVLKPNGLIIVLDMVAHTQQEFVRTMGHQHLGFHKKPIIDLAKELKLDVKSWYNLPKQEGAIGPQLFLGTLQKNQT